MKKVKELFKERFEGQKGKIQKRKEMNKIRRELLFQEFSVRNV